MAWLPAKAETTLRIATFHTELGRDGPGLLLRDILGGRDAQVQAVAQVVVAGNPDILLLQGVDHDAGGATARALRDALAKAGWNAPHVLAPAPNTGRTTGLDMDGDGRVGTPADAQGFGRFRGAGGMVLLSRWPILDRALRDFTPLLWRDLPGADPPIHPDGTDFPSAAALDVQRLASVGAWAVPVDLPGGSAPFWVLAMHACPPAFDGPEDRNGRRNADELRLWARLLDGALGPAPPPGRFALLGITNLDPDKGEGRRVGLRALETHATLHAPTPYGSAGTATVDWSDIGLGQRQVARIFPARGVTVRGSGVFWPAPDDPLAKVAAKASRHRLVWTDLMVPD